MPELGLASLVCFCFHLWSLSTFLKRGIDPGYDLVTPSLLILCQGFPVNLACLQIHPEPWLLRGSNQAAEARPHHKMRIPLCGPFDEEAVPFARSAL